MSRFPRFARFALLLLLCAKALAADATVDINTAAGVYLAAQLRQQISASLGNMPARIRQMFAADSQAKLSDKQLAAVTAAAERNFRIDVFEAPALAAFAANLDQQTVNKSLAFLESDTGKRMVAADVAVAKLDEATIDKITSGKLTAPSSPERDALIERLGQATQAATSAVQIYLGIGRAIAIGTALGSGADLATAEDRVKSRDAAGTEQGMAATLVKPLNRYIAYGYRDLSDADLKKLLRFLESKPGKTYVKAYVAAMAAGYDAMGRRCGGQIGESWHELAQAQSSPPPMAEPAP